MGGIGSPIGSAMHEPSATDQFLELYAGGQRRIYAYIRAHVVNSADADDVLQDVATVLWRKFAEYQPGSEFVRWACQVARLEVLAYHRHCKRLRTLFSHEVVEAVAEQVLELSDTAGARAELLDGCVQLLPPRDRELLDLRYEFSQSVKQIAVAVDRTESAVYKALQRIHDELYDCIEGGLNRKNRR
jgi:RNA polymerase sigma-70 factor (ECF subfamily)